MRTLDTLLTDGRWFAALDAAQQARLRAETVVREAAAQETVVHKGAPAEHWIGVIDGLVKIATVSADGRAVTFTGVPAGGWLGEGSMLKDEPRRYDVVALRASRVALVPRDTFRWLLDSSIAFNRFVLGQLNERLGQFIGTVEHDRLLGPQGRVARCLAQLMHPQLYPGSRDGLALSQAELGLLTGLSRQSVNRALRDLESRGLLCVHYGRIDVPDPDALRDAAP